MDKKCPLVPSMHPISIKGSSIYYGLKVVLKYALQSTPQLCPLFTDKVVDVLYHLSQNKQVLPSKLDKRGPRGLNQYFSIHMT